MTLTESLDLVVRQTGHGRYRELCSDDNPDRAQRDAYRGLVVRLAAGEPFPAPVRSAFATAQGWVPPIGGGCGGCH